MNLEERARKEIDRHLRESGWAVQDYPEMNIYATTGVAVREFPLRKGHGTVDYLLYADGKAIGSVEAKPEGFTLRGVETQSGKYAEGLREGVAAYGPALYFSYESTGTVTQFTNALEPDARSRGVFAFHRPEELIRLVRKKEQVRTALRNMPPLVEEGLWDAQVRAIKGLERSLAENDRTESQPLDRKRSVSIERLLQAVAEGSTDPDVASTLASRLARLDRRLSPEQRVELVKAAGGKDPKELVGTLIKSLDADVVARRAAEEGGLEEGQEPTEEQVREAEEAVIRDALMPFYDPALRKKILDIKSSFEQVIDETTPDELIEAGFDAAAKEKALALVSDFEKFVEENREEIEALKVLYSRPRRAGLRYGQIKELAEAIKRPPLSATPETLWLAYEAVEKSARDGSGGKKLADLISLVRHAIDHSEPLKPHAATIEERYETWLAEQEANGASFTPEQRRWLDAIKDHVATSLRIEREDFDYAPLSQLGGLGAVYNAFGNDLPRILDELNERLAA